VDVVQAGSLKRQAHVGASIGPVNRDARGSIGAYANDIESGATVAITAMHVSGRSDYPQAYSPQVRFCQPSRTEAGARPFGDLIRGTTTGVDAAKVSLYSPQDAWSFLPGGIGPIRGWRPTTFPGDRGTPVSLFGAASGFQSGHIVNPSTSLPPFNLEHAIIVDINSQAGDSGCSLVDPERLILGFLVGMLTSGLRVFSPVSLVLGKLRCRDIFVS
jgi:hypothetical protein